MPRAKVAVATSRLILAGSPADGITRISQGGLPGPAPSRPAMPHLLQPASALAFGPDGTSSGDNPTTASAAIDESTATAWRTQWYASAAFGNLKSGTGLFLDMGRPVKITSV